MPRSPTYLTSSPPMLPPTRLAPGASVGKLGDPLPLGHRPGCGCPFCLTGARPPEQQSFGALDFPSYGTPFWKWAVGVAGVPFTGGLSMALPLEHEVSLRGAKSDCDRAKFKLDKAKRMNKSANKIARLTQKYKKACGKYKAKNEHKKQKKAAKAAKKQAKSGGIASSQLSAMDAEILGLGPTDALALGPDGLPLTDTAMAPVSSTPNWLPLALIGGGGALLLILLLKK